MQEIFLIRACFISLAALLRWLVLIISLAFSLQSHNNPNLHRPSRCCLSVSAVGERDRYTALRSITDNTCCFLSTPKQHEFGLGY